MNIVANGWSSGKRSWDLLIQEVTSQTAIYTARQGQ